MSRVEHRVRWIVYALMVAAAASMLFQYASNLSMWRDEAALANNIVERDIAGLMQPLDYGQAAPVGFLIVAEAITQVFGTDEYALRLTTLIFGLLTIVLFHRLGNKVRPAALVFAMAFLVTSPLHLRYVAEFKQYIGDGFWALLLTILALDLSTAHRKETLMMYAGVGAVAVWFSHPAVFMLAGMGIVLFVDAAYQRDPMRIRWLVGVGAVQAISFGLAYLVSYRHVASGTDLASYMNDYWQDQFLRLDAVSIVQAFVEFFTWVSGLYQPVIFIMAIFGFILSLGALDRRTLALLLAPVGFLCIASLLQLYPIYNRMLLFFMPNLILLVAVGWWRVTRDIFQRQSRLGWVVMALLIALPLSRFGLPHTTTDTTEAREALAWATSVDPDKPLLITRRIVSIARYYGYTINRLEPDDIVSGNAWIVTDVSDGLNEFNLPANTSIYEFLQARVICVDTDCPEPSSDG